MGFPNRDRAGSRRLWLAPLAMLCGALHLHAVETDNFSMPADVEFADFGDFIEALHTHAVEAGVGIVNSRIERALNLKDPVSRRSELERWHSPEVLTGIVAARFGEAPLEKSRIEGTLGGAWARKTFPDQALYHHDLALNLRGRFVADPRALLMFIQSNTIKVYGVYFGTDKLVHFHQLGSQYYDRYQMLLRRGMAPEEARREVVEYFSEKAVLAEGRGFGTLLTGVYSNADMVANYLGFLFLLNLTEPVMLQGRNHEPLVVRCGVFWRLNDHVRLHSGWFRPFISDHLNEALNPNLYDATMRPNVRRILESRADRIVEFYTHRDGRPDAADYFVRLNHELSTYYGESYGHSGQFEKLMNVGNTCFPALQKEDGSACADGSETQHAEPEAAATNTVMR
jgi:hypothetical protein